MNRPGIFLCVLCLFSYRVAVQCDEAEGPPDKEDVAAEEPSTDADPPGEAPKPEPPAASGTPPEPEASAPPATVPEAPAEDANKPEVIPPEETTEAPVPVTVKTGGGGIDKTTVEYQFLKHINKYRKKGKQTNLTWSSKLEKKARKIGLSCVRSQDSVSSGLTVEYKKVKKLSAKKVVKNWFKQGKKVKNGNVNKCCNKKKKKCCRYAMLMSEDYKSVGCGYNFCRKVRGGSRKYRNTFAVVCLYK